MTTVPASGEEDGGGGDSGDGGGHDTPIVNEPATVGGVDGAGAAG